MENALCRRAGKKNAFLGGIPAKNKKPAARKTHGGRLVFAENIRLRPYSTMLRMRSTNKANTTHITG